MTPPSAEKTRFWNLFYAYFHWTSPDKVVPRWKASHAYGPLFGRQASGGVPPYDFWVGSYDPVSTRPFLDFCVNEDVASHPGAEQVWNEPGENQTELGTLQ